MGSADPGPSRRGFLGSTLALAGTLPLIVAEPVAATTAAAAALGPSGSRYLALSLSEAAFVEAMVNALCPGDRLTPDGVNSGLAAAIDANLAGATDGVPGQRALFKAGLAAADCACRSRTGRALTLLAPADARRFLWDVAAGDVNADFPVASWWADVVDPMLKQACFSGIVYDTYGSTMFWKMFG